MVIVVVLVVAKSAAKVIIAINARSSDILSDVCILLTHFQSDLCREQNVSN